MPGVCCCCATAAAATRQRHVFKEDLQNLADRLGLEIRVAHYPPYCSKHNPIEHRLFPHVTRACQGVTFHTVDIVEQRLLNHAQRARHRRRDALAVVHQAHCLLLEFERVACP